MKRRRNPDAVRSRAKAGVKNWLILGGVAVGGYVAYKHIGKATVEAAVTQAAASGGKKTVGPDLNGPMVTKFEIASTQTKNCIPTPVPGFVYSPVQSINPMTGYNTFNVTATGHFTRRLLCKGNQRWAEIKPA